VLAFGDTGPEMRDETFTRQAPCRSAYERTKTDAHRVALRFQQSGLPLIIACPNAVIGPNDHSVWGYFVRMYINRVMPPMAWAADTIFGCVEVDDLAEGIALAAEKGRLGETYALSGEFRSFRDHMALWTTRPGAFRAAFWLPASAAALAFAPLEPLQRSFGLPAFISRETVAAGATNMYLSAEKAKRELGWTHRSAEAAWNATIDGELELLARRKGQKLIQRLKPLDSMD
jgi:dihydroflavonol-4-reductase